MRRTAPHPHKGGRQDWATERALVRAVLRFLGIEAFAWDLAASAANAVADSYFTKRENALRQGWERAASGGVAWCNPPYAHLAPWMAKAAAAGRAGARLAFLVPAAVGANWWDDSVHGRARVIFLTGRPKFVGATQGYPKDCALVLYGPDVRPGYQTWRWRRDVAPSRLQRAA